MTSFYPVFLDLRGRRCVVVGGNADAQRKVIRLCEVDASVVVVSECVTSGLRDLASRGTIEWIERGYRRGDLKDAVLAITSPDARAVDAAVWHEAEAEGVLLNAMDDTSHCTFIAPAVHREGDLTVAISTGGKGPALAVRLRDRIAKIVGPEYGAFLDLLATLRGAVRQRVPDFDVRRALWYRMIDSEAMEDVRAGHMNRARRRLLDIMDELVVRNGRAGPSEYSTVPARPNQPDDNV